MQSLPPPVPNEEELPGGHLTRVVRVGDTVRRTAGAWTPAVHCLLQGLYEHGFAGAPVPLGFDELGREVLSYLDGDVGHDGWMADPHTYSLEILARLGQLLRDLHDTSLKCALPSGLEWQVLPGAPLSGEVICHNDIAPWNLVFRDGLPVALIDWDLAAPGPRVWDVAYVLWTCVPIWAQKHREELDLPAAMVAARTRTLLDAYGQPLSGVFDAIESHIEIVARAIDQWGSEGRPGWQQIRADGAHQNILRDLRSFRAARPAIQRLM